jgi:ParB-like nuclease domain
MSAISLLNVSHLLKHEQVDPDRVAELMNSITRIGVWTEPICVDAETKVIMDGHHRYEAAIQLGLAFIPARGFAYSEVIIRSRRDDFRIDAAEIRRRAMAGNLYPPKTTHHVFPTQTRRCAISLKDLRAPVTFRKHIKWVWAGGKAPHEQILGARYKHRTMDHQYKTEISI